MDRGGEYPSGGVCCVVGRVSGAMCCGGTSGVRGLR